jgi:hypothetical protein
VEDLNRAVTDLLNGRGQGGNFRVNAEGNELLDFIRTYEVQTHQECRLKVFIKQTEFEVEENENRYSVSEKIAAAFGMPSWSVFKLCPVDNAIQRIGNHDLSNTFERIDGKQYRWENVYDPAVDRRNEGGRSKWGTDME